MGLAECRTLQYVNRHTRGARWSTFSGFRPGLSCDGDSVALTGAMQPSIEEIALGALPGLPKSSFTGR
jgi:hypothetical protein